MGGGEMAGDLAILNISEVEALMRRYVQTLPAFRRLTPGDKSRLAIGMVAASDSARCAAYVPPEDGSESCVLAVCDVDRLTGELTRVIESAW